MLDFMKEKQETSSDVLDVDAIRKRIKDRHQMTFDTMRNMRSFIDATFKNINENAYIASPYSHTTFEFVRRCKFYLPLYQRMIATEAINMMDDYSNHSYEEVLFDIYNEIDTQLQYVSAVEARIFDEGATV